MKDQNLGQVPGGGEKKKAGARHIKYNFFCGLTAASGQNIGDQSSCKDRTNLSEEGFRVLGEEEWWYGVGGTKSGERGEGLIPKDSVRARCRCVGVWPVPVLVLVPRKGEENTVRHCWAVERHDHVPMDFRAHDEGTDDADSIRFDDQGGCSTRESVLGMDSFS